MIPDSCFYDTDSMNIASDLAALFDRDLTRLIQEVQSFPSSEDLWKVAPGGVNSAGNLALHLEGNLREFVGRLLGNVAYERKREQEFSQKDLSKAELLPRIEEVRKIVTETIASLSAETFEKNFPVKIVSKESSTFQILVSLHAHLSWHLGQIDSIRRFVTNTGSIELAQI